MDASAGFACKSALHLACVQRLRGKGDPTPWQSRGGVLILGHGAPLVLRNRSGAFRVLIAGSVDCRARRAVAEVLSWDEAVQTTRNADEERVAYFHTFCDAGWLDPATYDLVVNTDRLHVEAAAFLIAAAVRMRAGAGSPTLCARLDNG